VQVQLAEVPLSRLRRLLGDVRADSFSQAVMLGQRFLDALAPPELVVDLAEGSLRIGGVEMERGTARVLWIATLAQARLPDPGPGCSPASCASTQGTTCLSPARCVSTDGVAADAGDPIIGLCQLPSGAVCN
jgi:hypothetical protein